MKRSLPLCLLMCGLVAAQEKSESQPVPDLLRGPVDPFLLGQQRAGFLKAAKVDSRLDEGEFQADGQSPGGFVRPFDKWAVVKAFDKNKDGQLDWFEAEAYRQSLRKAVIVKYDANKNGKLEGPERDAANKDLAAGKVPDLGQAAVTVTVTPSAAPTPTSPGKADSNPASTKNILANFLAAQNQPTPQITFSPEGQLLGLPKEAIKAIDSDGDGALSQEERLDVADKFVQGAGQWLLKQYDSDGDGKISEAERQAMPRPIQFGLRLKDLAVRDYDEDGDGKLSRQEQAAIDDDLQLLANLGQKSATVWMDSDKDGQVSPAEFQVLAKKSQTVVMQALPKVLGWVDSNHDNQIQPEEGLAMFDRVTEAFDRQSQANLKKYDANSDGRLSAAERVAAIQGWVDDDAARMKRMDADGDGQLSVSELSQLYDEAFEQWGVKPKPVR